MEEKKILTKEQEMAQKAWKCVSDRRSSFKDEDFDKYSSFALAFPALIHSCGLVQAVAFASRDDKDDKKSFLRDFMKDLQDVFNTIDKAGDLKVRSREAELAEYSRISRHALAAASWIKRYCQALDKQGNKGGMSLAELP